MKKVYTIVLMEESTAEFRKFSGDYIHRGKWIFDSGLNLELLQDFFFIPLDIFKKIMDNEKRTSINKLEAWLYFISSDRPEDIQRVIADYPEFTEMYQEIVYFRYHPEEAVRMFSEALQILDENTVEYMIDEMRREAKQEIEKLKQEAKQEAEQLREEAKQEIERLNKELDAQKQENDRLRVLLSQTGEIIC